jgi:hypothetical protein
MPSAVHMVCQLYNTAIQFNAGRLHGFLVVQPSYTNATCHRPSIWCAGCIILPYSSMPAGCMVPWLYNHLIPMPHASRHPYGLPAAQYCYIIQCQLGCMVCRLYTACQPFHAGQCMMLAISYQPMHAGHSIPAAHLMPLMCISCRPDQLLATPPRPTHLHHLPQVAIILVPTTQYISLLPRRLLGPPVCNPIVYH